jgi:hypothetical protein
MVLPQYTPTPLLRQLIMLSMATYVILPPFLSILSTSWLKSSSNPAVLGNVRTVNASLFEK